MRYPQRAQLPPVPPPRTGRRRGWARPGHLASGTESLWVIRGKVPECSKLQHSRRSLGQFLQPVEAGKRPSRSTYPGKRAVLGGRQYERLQLRIPQTAREGRPYERGGTRDGDLSGKGLVHWTPMLAAPLYPRAEFVSVL
ncbi:MAG: hypothetical protein ACTSRS_07580 [Candidatus Helarchaeota archaeon]